jgi:nucleoside transporter
MENTTTYVAPAPGVKFKLSVMMFFQYMIWGAWLPLLWPFLSEHRHLEPGQIGNMFAAGAAGALLAPFIAGQIADRYFPTERFLGISHIIGGLLIWQLANIEQYTSFLAFSFFYSVVYSPTLPLTNALAFHHIPDRDRDFGKVRAWGTIGWIAAGLTIGQWLAHSHTPVEGTKEAIRAAQVAGMADAFKLSGVLGIVMGVFCFFLPHTPPSKGTKQFAAGEAFTEITHNPRLIALFLFSIVVSCIHQFYFVHASGYVGLQQSGVADSINKIFGVGGGGLMTIGQMSEFFVLAAIPMVSKTVSRKMLLAGGLVCYALRMFLFAFTPGIVAATGLPTVAVLMSGIALHGFCFGLFIFVSFMIVDEETTGDVRASAQSLYNLVIVGVGGIVGSIVAGKIAAYASHEKGMDYQTLFSVPMYAAVIVLGLLLALYPSGKKQPAAVAAGVGAEHAEKA